jgi:Domain of unknown function (DUF4124)
MEFGKEVTVIRILIAIAFLLAAATAGAQMYRWVDKDGKVRYGDTPPPGAKTSSVKAPPLGGVAPATATKDAKDAKKGPLTPAEQEQEYRKRQDEAKKASEKTEKDNQAQAAKNDACERAREYMQTLESGQRIQRTNASGERYYLDEGQVAQESAKAQQTIQQACK